MEMRAFLQSVVELLDHLSMHGVECVSVVENIKTRRMSVRDARLQLKNICVATWQQALCDATYEPEDDEPDHNGAPDATMHDEKEVQNSNDEERRQRMARRAQLARERAARAAAAVLPPPPSVPKPGGKKKKKTAERIKRDAHDKLMRIEAQHQHEQSLVDREKERIASIEKRLEMVRIGDSIGRG